MTDDQTDDPRPQPKVMFRVLTSPTDFHYAVVDRRDPNNGTTIHYTMKRLLLHHPEMQYAQLNIISRDDFADLRSANPGCPFYASRVDNQYCAGTVIASSGLCQRHHNNQ